jgi:hypothetical protein
MPDYTPITAEIRARIAAIPDLVIIDDPGRLEEFGKDKTPGAFHRPELVVEATEAVQIQALLRLANVYRFPVIPRGLGTGLAGGAIPVHGGVVLSLARMDRIIAIEPRNMIAVVEPGVRNLDLKNAVREHGLCYPRIRRATTPAQSGEMPPRTRAVPPASSTAPPVITSWVWRRFSPAGSSSRLASGRARGWSATT